MNDPKLGERVVHYSCFYMTLYTQWLRPKAERSRQVISLFYFPLWSDSAWACQSQEPSFQPCLHLSSTLLQSNSDFPNRTLMPLWRWQSHCERWWRLLVSGWFVFNLTKDLKNINALRKSKHLVQHVRLTNSMSTLGLILLY